MKLFWLRLWQISRNRKVRSHKDLINSFADTEKEFYKKILPSGLNLTDAQKKIAWAKTWNAIIEKLYEDDLVKESEKNDYSYVITDTDNIDWLSGIASLPNREQWSERLLNDDAEDQILFYLNSLFMDMKRQPTWDRMLGRTVMVPVYKEDVLYLLNGGTNHS